MEETHYACIGKLKMVPIEGAKTLQMGFYNGLPFATDISLTSDDLLVIFFPDGRLSEEYANANDLISRKDPNTGKQVGGFFGKNRKVRAVKFMKGKIESVGFVARIETLKKVGVDISTLKEGDTFNGLQGIKICEKFIGKATKTYNSGKQNRRKSKDLIGFDQHQDTKQLYSNMDCLQPGDLVTVTEKLDGTSSRFGLVYETIHFNWLKKLINRFIPLLNMKYSYVKGTRKVVLMDSSSDRTTSFYGDDNIYTEVPNSMKGMLHAGEVIYGEIVGWISPEKPLFTRGGVSFIYGTKPGTRNFYVYAIKHVLPDGTTRHISHDAVKERAGLLGLKIVPELLSTKISADADIAKKQIDYILNNFIPKQTVGKSTIENSDHIREGVVLRIDRGSSTRFLKSKSAEFYGLEDKFKNDEKNVDIEESN